MGGWDSLSSARKAGIIVLVSGILVAVVFFSVFMGKPKYDPLFLNMAPEDMAKVVEGLKQQKVNYKLSGDTILVPADKVEELRLSVASSGSLPSSGKGFELFDQSRFGMTDTETKIQYQRALETELQRTIKAFDEVDQAIVHLVLPDQSVFVRDEQPARASITLKLKNDKKLSPDQVKSIVALISGSVKNLSKENGIFVSPGIIPNGFCARLGSLT
jgi:flagellar M-ring protein FliF